MTWSRHEDPEYEQNALFVNTLREVLGLDDLYSLTASRYASRPHVREARALGQRLRRLATIRERSKAIESCRAILAALGNQIQRKFGETS